MLTRRLISFTAVVSTCLASLASFALPACGGTEREIFDGDGGTSDASISPPADSGPTISSGGSSGSGPRTGPAEVFVHSGDTLYKLDPNSAQLELSKVGKFSGLNGTESMVDIALNEAGEMYGTSYDGVYRVEKTTGACTRIKAAAKAGEKEYPDSLSFAPKGTVDPDREVLVGYRGSDYISIDPESGVIDVIKANALGAQLVSSGDIVSIRDGDFLTYLSVKPLKSENCTGECAKCKDNDCLFQVDPATGERLSNLGSTKRANVFGLAYWAGTLYGINTEGKLFKIETDSPPVVTNINIPGGLGTIKFFGAGSSTSAPAGPN